MDDFRRLELGLDNHAHNGPCLGIDEKLTMVRRDRFVRTVFGVALHVPSGAPGASLRSTQVSPSEPRYGRGSNRPGLLDLRKTTDIHGKVGLLLGNCERENCRWFAVDE